jgi:hypothetical protein
MGKRDKEHKKKVAKRNERLSMERKKFEKQQRNFFMELIEREKAAGKFDNNQTIPFNLTGDVLPILGQPLSISPDTIGPQI